MMNTQNSTLSHARSAEFSEALNQGHRNKEIPLQSNSSYERNISSVLSQIQDNGPAYDERETSKNTTLNNQQQNALDSSYKQNALENRTENMVSTSALWRNQLTGKQWVPFLLILLVTSVMVIFMINFELRTSQLEAAISDLDDTIEENLSFQDDNLSPQFASLNKTLKSLKMELQLIKNNVQSSDKEYADVIDKKFSQHSNDSVSIKDTISNLKVEMSDLKSELLMFGNKYKAIGSYHRSNITGSGLVPANTNDWVVNLASLKSRNKAELAIKRLSAAGLSPQIQETIVNGEVLYRLSVGGFNNREAAESFVRTADKKYGMKNGWVRRS